MAKFDIIMPKLGESIQEATITKWFKKEGDKVEEDDVLLEIATDKVDSEIPSPVEGVISKILYKENDTVAVGEVIAIIDLDGEEQKENKEDKKEVTKKEEIQEKPEEIKKPEVKEQKIETDYTKSKRFYSPLVKNIAKKEGISLEQLDSIKGSGLNERVTKQDILSFIENNKSTISKKSDVGTKQLSDYKITVPVYEGDEIVQMDRMRKIIADHMVMSKRISAHVTNIIEVDVTNMALWRNKIKDEFFKKEKQKITFLPMIIEIVSKTLREFPGINASVDGDKIIIRKNINIGIAVALPNNNLIVPVIKNTEQKSLVGITTELNTLAANARNNKLSPDDIQGGTFSITNFGTFKNQIGTPVINQPQVAILAVGTIEKKPAVLETPTGDVIAIRQKMYLSLSYDHRVIDGALGGAFLYRIKELLESFDVNRSI